MRRLSGQFTRRISGTTTGGAYANEGGLIAAGELEGHLDGAGDGEAEEVLVPGGAQGERRGKGQRDGRGVRKVVVRLVSIWLA